jgi:NAD-dependent SIR2 family protein deacetylase
MEGNSSYLDKQQQMLQIYNEFQKKAQKIHNEIKEIIRQNRRRLDQKKLEIIRKNIDKIV